MGSKSAATAHKIRHDFQGTLVVDSFAVYPIVAELEKGMQVAQKVMLIRLTCKKNRDVIP